MEPLLVFHASIKLQTNPVSYSNIHGFQMHKEQELGSSGTFRVLYVYG